MRPVTYHHNNLELDFGRAWTHQDTGTQYSAAWWYSATTDDMTANGITTQVITDPELILIYNNE